VARKKNPAQIKIRLPEALRRDLEREAAKTGRTLNGEIVYRLTQPFVQADRRAIAAAAASDTVKSILENTGFGSLFAKVSPDLLAKAQRAVGLPVPNLPTPEEAGPPVPKVTKTEEDKNG
jgi:hypothetical protein